MYLFSFNSAELLGFDRYITPYSQARGQDILRGVNYASAAAGIRDETGQQLVLIIFIIIIFLSNDRKKIINFSILLIFFLTFFLFYVLLFFVTGSTN